MCWVKTPLLCSRSNYLLIYLGRQREIAQVFEPLPLMLETRVEFLALDLNLERPGYCSHLGSGPENGNSLCLFLCFSLLLCYTFKVCLLIIWRHKPWKSFLCCCIIETRSLHRSSHLWMLTTSECSGYYICTTSWEDTRH